MLSLNILTAAAALIASATAQFNPQSKTNVAVYWGQGPNQLRLIEHCKRPAIDIINVGFVNQFPGTSQSGDELPGSNFGKKLISPLPPSSSTPHSDMGYVHR